MLSCGDECSDCDGRGVVEKGSDIQLMQARVKYRHGKRRYVPDAGSDEGEV